MSRRNSIGVATLAVVLSLSANAAWAQDNKKYPDWDGLWSRGSRPGSWDPTKPSGLGQQAPLTPEYQGIFEANLAKGKAGIAFDIKNTCGPIGMPRIMTLYGPMEISIKPNATYMLMEHTSPVRRIYTDGRDWPQNPNPAFVGYSIGKWLDTDGDGIYDTLEVETRHLKGPLLFDDTGIPLAADGETVIKEKIYLDKADRDIMHDEITTFDHALTRPWAVSRFFRREHEQNFEEFNCSEDNHWTIFGGRWYLTDSEGYLMPIVKDETPPDPKYLQKYFNQPKK